MAAVRFKALPLQIERTFYFVLTKNENTSQFFFSFFFYCWFLLIHIVFMSNYTFKNIFNFIKLFDAQKRAMTDKLTAC